MPNHPLHPQSLRELERLIELHGARPIIKAARKIEQRLADEYMRRIDAWIDAPTNPQAK